MVCERSLNELLRRVKSSATTYIGDETSFKYAKQSASDEEGGFTVQAGLSDGNDGPHDHLRGACD